MRRKRMAAFQPVTLRSGVIARVMHRKRSVQTPVSLVTSLSGFALRFPVSPAQISQANGPRLAMKTRGLSTHRTARSESLKPQPLAISHQLALVISLQIHPAIHAGHLITVAVEHQRLAPQELADAAFGRLRPARMVDGRVHVRVEAVLLRRRFLPSIERLLLDELDLDDRLDVLEPVLPGDDEPERRAILIRDDFVVQADGQDR